MQLRMIDFWAEIKSNKPKTRQLQNKKLLLHNTRMHIARCSPVESSAFILPINYICTLHTYLSQRGVTASDPSWPQATHRSRSEMTCSSLSLSIDKARAPSCTCASRFWLNPPSHLAIFMAVRASKLVSDRDASLSQKPERGRETS
jgi:hypothetical protein